mmetsp:Transcript_1292/g.2080  ORF Transcript_1292/g.2080 Transcript_1292/m.2080 type:complete len:617 (+) Transcript_1292:2-1852(+)
MFAPLLPPLSTATTTLAPTTTSSHSKSGSAHFPANSVQPAGAGGGTCPYPRQHVPASTKDKIRRGVELFKENKDLETSLKLLKEAEQECSFEICDPLLYVNLANVHQRLGDMDAAAKLRAQVLIKMRQELETSLTSSSGSSSTSCSASVEERREEFLVSATKLCTSLAAHHRNIQKVIEEIHNAYEVVEDVTAKNDEEVTPQDLLLDLCTWANTFNEVPLLAADALMKDALGEKATAEKLFRVLRDRLWDSYEDANKNGMGEIKSPERAIGSFLSLTLPYARQICRGDDTPPRRIKKDYTLEDLRTKYYPFPYTWGEEDASEKAAISKIEREGCTIDRRVNLTTKELLRQYIDKGKPVIIGDLLKDWPGRVQCSRAKLLASHGDDHVRAKVSPDIVAYGNQDTREGRGKEDEEEEEKLGEEMDLRSYIFLIDELQMARNHSSSERVPLYLFTRDWKKWMLDCFQDLELFNSSVFNRKEERQKLSFFFLGATGTWTDYHYHSNAYNVVAYGAKEWLLFPPSLNLDTNMRAEWHSLPKNRRESYMKHYNPLRCVQYAGEVLVVPSYWPHAVRNHGVVLGTASEVSDTRGRKERTMSQKRSKKKAKRKSRPAKRRQKKK